MTPTPTNAKRHNSLKINYMGGGGGGGKSLCIKHLLTTITIILLSFFTPPALAADVGDYATLLTDAAAAIGDPIITLNADILNGTTQLTIGRNLTLDLAGYNLTIELPDTGGTGGRNSNGIKIASGITLTIMDSGGTGTLSVTNLSTLSGVGSGAAINITDGNQLIHNSHVCTNSRHMR